MDIHNNKKPWYKKWWVWLIIIVVLIGIGGAAGKEGAESPSTSPATNTPQSTEAPAKEEPKAEKWDVEANYAKINNGMTKADVETAIAKESDNCSESATEYIGKTEMCTYGSFGDNGMITVHYTNDVVSSKSKNKF